MNSPSRYSRDISFVIIGKNAEWSIARLLESILADRPADLTSEIIYVDSASTDHTLDIVRRYPVTIVQLPASQPLCASAGRFMGSQYASGRSIVFLDSDMELLNGWLSRALKVLDQHSEIAVVSGVQINCDPAVSPQEQGAVEMSRTAEAELTEIRFAGSAAVFRHEVLDAVGTWNPYIISDEEPELCLRIRRAGHRIVELSSASVRHFGYAAPTLSGLLKRRKRRLFLGYGQVIRYHLWTSFMFAYLRERGWVVLPLVVGLAMIGFVILSLASGNTIWFGGALGILFCAFALDAIRRRSLYRALYHVFQRALIVEGTIRGLFMHPHPPGGYPSEAKMSDQPDGVSVEPALARNHFA